MATLLRQKILDSGLSANALSKIAGVQQVRISAFLRGEGISLSTAQKLADHFGLKLVDDQPRGKKC